MMKRIFLSLTALTLAACSGGDQAQSSLYSEAALAARAIWQQKQAPAPGGAGLPAGLSRAAIAGTTTPMILTRIDTLGASGTLLKTAESQGYVTWVSTDRLTLTTRDGVISGTRGLRHDLMSAETAPTLAALRAGGASGYSRTLRHISGDRKIELSRLTCQMVAVGAETIEVLGLTHSTRHFAETCTDSGGTVLRNDYWRGQDGTLWRSRQFLHPITGYIQVDRLIR